MRRGLACLWALSLWSCGDQASPTQTMVVIDAEHGVRAATEALRVRVQGIPDDGAEAFEDTFRSTDSALIWPRVVALEPKDGDVSREYSLIATALDANGTFVAQVQVISGYARGKQLRIDLLLEDACIRKECDPDQTCRDGACADARVDVSSLAPFSESDLPDAVLVPFGDRMLPVDAGVGGQGGAAGSPMGGSGGESGASGSGGGDCVPNPDRDNEVCTEVCPETCNNEDDDCDRRIDEHAADTCNLPNATAECVRGECLVDNCLDDKRNCDGAPENGCEAEFGTVEHCAACNDACEFDNAIAACLEGACVPVGCLDTHADCNESPETCETPTTTLTDCGDCGVVCDNLDRATPTCATGECAVDTCIGNWGDCNRDASDGCELELNSAEHCGACDMGCAFLGTTSDCSSGTCLALGCDPAFADCDGNDANGCESLDTPEHCGGCGKPCSTSALSNVQSAQCAGQVCTIECEDGYGDCDTDASNGCETKLDSNVHCGYCGVPCGYGNAIADCSSGLCEFVECLDGWGDCDDDLMNGCEVDTSNAVDHCGSCDHDCEAQSVPKNSCSGGHCSGAICAANEADCNGDDVCDTDLTLLASCGSCSNACVFTGGLTPTTAHGSLSCSNASGSYACAVTCASGWGNCDGDYKNGCETSLTTLGNCGTCGQGCSIPNATESCSTGQCKVTSCDANWGNCDADPDTCERPLDTTSNCGGCNVACDLPYANEACTGTWPNKTCSVSSCAEASRRNCDNLNPNGCEVDASSNVSHCGGCNNNCNSLPNVNVVGCSNSACTITSCDSGWGNCTGAPGCETITTTTTNCGACGNDCTALANTATVTCNGGASCGISTCDPGYANCNGTVGDGCETDLYTLANCGGCANVGMNQNCAGLPNVAAAACPSGSCAVMACNSGWADCNGMGADGCEHDVNALGACDPDTMCTSKVWPSNGHTYWFCTNSRTRDDARSRCTMLTRSDLANVGSAAENAFLYAELGGTSAWLGGADATREGTWTWSSNGIPFWKGVADGSTISGAFANWSAMEPNDFNMGLPGEDCVSMRPDGLWNDETCSLAKAFVCEVSPDECPSDASKWDPGQCGCGVADTDGDGDLVANCIDGCPGDPNKIGPGVCGCNMADTDTDGDTFADCIENCDNDPLKQDPGACGCGTPDTDSDGDGTPNCNDGCPGDPNATMPPCAGFGYDPLNFDPGSLSFTANVNVNCNVTLTSGASATAPVSICGTNVTPVVMNQKVAGGPQVWVLPMQSLNVASGFTLKLNGTLPVVIAVQGNATIAGTIDAGSATNTVLGAGANVTCSPGTGANGAAGWGNGGGGGGGYGTAGNAGGNGGGTWGQNGGNGGGGGGAGGVTAISPLRGGCSGGNDGDGNGGGAVQLSVDGTLTLASTAIMSTSGGGGTGNGSGQGGSGGGSGGSVLLEATTFVVHANAWITANGGGGASGGGGSGANGASNNTARAAGGASGATGGQGAALAGSATVGAAGAFDSSYVIRNGGGGGGGGVGRIRFHGLTAGCASTVPTARISPAALVNCQ